MVPVKTLSEALEYAGSGGGFIMPRGAALLPRVVLATKEAQKGGDVS
jgi:hypothetical protein